MTKLSPKERKKQRDYLVRKRKSLFSKGADAKEVYEFLGGYDFKGLSDNKLSSLYNRAKSQPKVSVVKGKIYSNDFLKKAKSWYGKDFLEEKLTQGFLKSKKSFLNSFNSLAEIRSYKNKRDNIAKQRYIDMVEVLIHDMDASPTHKKKARQTLAQIKKFSNKRFKEFLSSPYADKISFDSLLSFIQTDDGEINGYIDNDNSVAFVKDLTTFVSSFNKARK